MVAQVLETISDRHYGRRVLAVALAGVIGAGFLTWFMYSLILTGDRGLDESGRKGLIRKHISSMGLGGWGRRTLRRRRGSKDHSIREARRKGST